MPFGWTAEASGASILKPSESLISIPEFSMGIVVPPAPPTGRNFARRIDPQVAQ